MTALFKQTCTQITIMKAALHASNLILQSYHYQLLSYLPEKFSRFIDFVYND